MTDSLAEPVQWTDAGVTPVLAGEHVQVYLPAEARNRYYRLTELPALEALGEGRLRRLSRHHQNYEVEVSDDLEPWSSPGVVATDEHRPLVLDPTTGNHPYRFHRAQSQ